jgi:hypothetical protein
VTGFGAPADVRERWRTFPDAAGKKAKKRGLPSRKTQRHDAFMRLPWNKPNVEQLDLVGDASPEPILSLRKLPRRSLVRRQALKSLYCRSTLSRPTASL